MKTLCGVIVFANLFIVGSVLALSLAVLFKDMREQTMSILHTPSEFGG